MLGSLILCLNGMRIMMFQLSGFYYRFGAVSVCFAGFAACLLQGS